MGSRLKQVSLLGPHSIVARDIRSAYGELVTPALLARWLAEPGSAPGRATSSPSPERIDLDSLTAVGSGECRAVGNVVYVTSAELAAGSGAASRIQVMMRQQRNGRWLIADYRENLPT
jgi:hypothetical protein